MVNLATYIGETEKPKDKPFEANEDIKEEEEYMLQDNMHSKKEIM